MPPRPRSPKARAGVTRRPRVAGLTPVTQRPDTHPDGERSLVRPAEPTRPGAFTDDPLTEPDHVVAEPAKLDQTPARPAEPERRAVDRDAPDDAEPVDTEPVDAEPVDAEPVDATEPAEPVATPAANAPFVEPAPARPSPARRPALDPDPAEPTTEAIPIVDPAVLDTAVLDLRALRTEPAERRADATEGLTGAWPEPDSDAGDAEQSEAEVPAEQAPAKARRASLTGLPKQAPYLAAAFVLLIAAAVTFGVLDARLHGTPTAANTALVDVAGTAEAAGQLSDALETVYSFDFTRLDENERAAREVITPAFAAEFDRLFADVRQRAPEQQAVVSATVTLSAVKELTGDHAVLVAFVDQQATRAAPDAQSRQLAAAGRLTVTGERVDGHWKIASVVPG
jgi:Mce-associated membrane protein